MQYGSIEFKIYQMKFSIKLLTILAIILAIISAVLFISKEYIGGIVTSILFVAVLLIIMWFKKMKKDLELKIKQYGGSYYGN